MCCYQSDPSGEKGATDRGHGGPCERTVRRLSLATLATGVANMIVVGAPSTKPLHADTQKKRGRNDDEDRQRFLGVLVRSYPGFTCCTHTA